MKTSNKTISGRQLQICFISGHSKFTVKEKMKDSDAHVELFATSLSDGGKLTIAAVWRDVEAMVSNGTCKPVYRSWVNT